MKEVFIDIMKANIGPLAFILVAGALCYLLPDGDRSEAVCLVIGAALTRVKGISAK